MCTHADSPRLQDIVHQAEAEILNYYTYYIYGIHITWHWIAHLSCEALARNLIKSISDKKPIYYPICAYAIETWHTHISTYAIAFPPRMYSMWHNTHNSRKQTVDANTRKQHTAGNITPAKPPVSPPLGSRAHATMFYAQQYKHACTTWPAATSAITAWET